MHSGAFAFEGEITICGYGNKSLEAKRLLGYVPEMPAVYDLLTVGEHLEFIARAYGLTNWQEKAESLLERFELADKKEQIGKRTFQRDAAESQHLLCASAAAEGNHFR